MEAFPFFYIGMVPWQLACTWFPMGCIMCIVLQFWSKINTVYHSYLEVNLWLGIQQENKRKIEKRSIVEFTIVHLLTFKVCLVSIHFTYLGVSKTNQMTCHPTFQLNECLAMCLALFPRLYLNMSPHPHFHGRVSC